MIALSGVSKLYRTLDIETVALDSVDITVDRGEFIAVTGPSGCGKSTLLNVIGMIDRVSEGSYSFDGLDVSGQTELGLARLRRGRIGFVFQAFNLIESMSVFQNVELPLVYQGIPASVRRNHVRESLELVGLSARARHRPSLLSGGEQQRVAIARAVVTDPELLLADEPTGNLDSANGADVMDMLQTLNHEGATILMVTHSEAHAACANRRIDMLDGRIVGRS